MKKKGKLIVLILLLGILFYCKDDIYNYTYSLINSGSSSSNVEDIEDYNGNSYVIVNDNNPYFKEEEYTTNSFEKYSDLDSLGRCGVAYANISKELMPTEKRGSNTKGMLQFENMVTKYIKDTGNHVLYRITPVFEGNNLVATGVEMEAYSVEDNGEGIKFNVFVYNIEDGIIIDYKTGDSKLAS